MGTGANSASGPSRFGESTTLERSRRRNSSGRYSSAIAAPPTTRNPIQTTAAKALFRPIHGLLKLIKIELRTSCRKPARQCQPFLPARLLANYGGREKLHGPSAASTLPLLRCRFYSAASATGCPIALSSRADSARYFA